ncbi:MAG: 30S ribosomal protein S7 [Nitrososphaerota archaeon]|nr:30S ribosomal protein S7 [Nitrososphaerota archaeon]MDG6927768.1 30S ribosomal protein S7 [Nitrososphaerota archaeon]MDG6930307.1 30S ribosomal protein S7 [Nitrososphaerota archaeon]MDG6932730.1 30S ribosomal protein S7 [Nitrososphaerota archaeon]MDG6935353.1 30S ribosomal protein S7 [Nitrososphaerota archaeon]
MSEQKTMLFDKWDYEGIAINDISLSKIINVKPVYVPHTFGRGASKRFAKERVNVVERLINNMMHYGKLYAKNTGRMAGKKWKVMNIVKSSLEIIQLRTKKNPIQVLVDAVVNAGPNEDTTRISYGGVVYHVSVDVSPNRRLDLALRYITQGARFASFRTGKPIEESLAEELMLASTNDQNSYSIRKKQEQEKMAAASR